MGEESGTTKVKKVIQDGHTIDQNVLVKKDTLVCCVSNTRRLVYQSIDAIKIKLQSTTEPSKYAEDYFPITCLEGLADEPLIGEEFCDAINTFVSEFTPGEDPGYASHAAFYKDLESVTSIGKESALDSVLSELKKVESDLAGTNQAISSGFIEELEYIFIDYQVKHAKGSTCITVKCFGKEHYGYIRENMSSHLPYYDFTKIIICDLVWLNTLLYKGVSLKI